MVHPKLHGMSFLDDGRLLTWGHRNPEVSHVRLWDPGGALTTLYTTGAVVDARGRHLLIDRHGLELVYATNGRRVRRLGERKGWNEHLIGEGRVTWKESKVTVVRPGREALVLDAKAELTTVTYDDGGKRLVTSARDNRVRLWDLTSGEELLAIAGDDDADHLSLSADGKRLAMDVPPAVWDLEANQAVFELPLAPSALAISPDGKRLAAVHEGDLVVYDVDEARMAWMRPDIDDSYVGAPMLAFSQDGRQLAAATVGDERSRIRTFAAETGKPVGSSVIDPPAVSVTAPGGEIWVGTGHGDIVVFDPDDADAQARLLAHGRTVRSLVHSPSGRLVASASDDGVVILWDRETRTERTRFGRLHTPTLAFLDEERLLIGHTDEASVLWHVDQPPPDLWRQDTSLPPLEGRAPLSAGRKTFTLTRSTTIAFVDAATLRHLGSLEGRYGDTHYMSPAGDRLVTSDHGRLTLWDTAKMTAMHDRQTEGRPTVAWGGGWLVVADGPQLRVLSDTGEDLRETQHGQGDIAAVAVVDDDRFVTLSADGLALMWSRKAMPTPTHPAKAVEGDPPPKNPLPPVGPSRDCGPPVADGQGGHLPPCAIRRFGRRHFGHDTNVERLTFSPDGHYLAGEGGSYDRGVSIWDAKTGERHMYLPTSHMPLSVVFHPDGQSVFIRAGRQLAHWPLAGGPPRMVSVGYSDYDATAISPAGTHLAVGDAYGQVMVLDASTLKKVGAFRAGVAPVRRLGFVGEDGLVAQTLTPQTALWRWRSGEKAADLFGDFAGFAMLPDGRLFGVDADVLRVGLPPKVYRTRLEVGEYDNLAIARDGKTVAITATDYDEKTFEDLPERVEIYDLKTQTSRRSITIGDTDAIALSPDGAWLAVAKGSSVEMWNTQTGKPRAHQASHHGATTAAAFADGGKTIITSDGRDVLRWDAKTGAALGTPWRMPSVDPFILPGGKQLIAIDDDDAAVWTIGSATTPLKDFDVFSIEDPSVAPDGKHMAFLDYGSRLHIVRLPNVELVHKVELPEEEYENTAFLPGKLVIGGEDEVSLVYDVATGKLLQTLPAIGPVVTASDGRWTVIGNVVFDQDLKRHGRLDEALTWVPLAVSPQGWAAIRGPYDAVHIYDLKTLRRILRLPAALIGTAAVSPDGGQLLTGGEQVLLWNIAPHLN